MNTIIIYVVVYIFYLSIWFTSNLVLYAVAVATKRPNIYGWVEGISYLIIWVLNILIGIGLLLFNINLFLGGQILWAVIFFFVGMGILSMFLNLLQMPFVFITTYFSEKIKSINFDENIAAAEVLDEKGNVVIKLEGDTTKSIRLAQYFVADYFLIILYVYLNRQKPQYADYGLWSWVTEPLFWLGSEVIVFGFIYLIYNLIRYKKLFPFGKKHFVTQIVRIDIVITFIMVCLSVLGILLA